MSAAENDIRKLLQIDTREAIERIGTEPWLNVYSSDFDGVASEAYFCALVPEARLERAMAHASWDLGIGDGMPGCSQSHAGGRTVTEYHRFGSDDGVEPLVIKRDFHGLKPACIELLEEFRHFHNLYYDHHNGRYIHITDGGEEEVLAEVSATAVRVRTRAIRQFLAIRRMHLMVFFDIVIQVDIDLHDIPAADRAVEHADSAVRYSFHVSNEQFAGRAGGPFSRLLGKKVINPLSVEHCGIWPYEGKRQQFAEFIIGLDSNGEPIMHTCDAEKLGDYFGKNPAAPHFLTPVVFRRDVLKKYYEHPEKYAVEDGYLSCGSLWGLRLDNDADDRVTVFLGDLGETLSYEEQLYWKSFNKPPEGGGRDLSQTNIQRSFRGEFADPMSPELVFKSRFTTFQEAWEKKFGWQLIQPLRNEDAHVFKRLHAPTTSSTSEFEDQVILLTKLLVDSLNDAKLVQELGSAVPDEKSIAKFERFLTAKSYPEARRDIEFLRLLQEVRSSAAAHRKGDGYKKVAKKLNLDNRPVSEVFAELLRSGIAMLGGLSAFFLAANGR